MAKPSTSQIERLIGAVQLLAAAVNDLREQVQEGNELHAAEYGYPAKAPAVTPVPTTAPPAPPAAAPAAKPVSGIRYEELAAAVLKVAEVKGQSAAVAILKSFGATHAKQLSEDKYADALAAFESALNTTQALA